MDQEELRASYLKLLKKSPSLKSAILSAAKGGGSVTLSFESVYDSPFLLYACWGFARSVGVTLILPPDGHPAQ